MIARYFVKEKNINVKKVDLNNLPVSVTINAL